MIDAVLCELEGVLIDSAAQRRRALQLALAGERFTLPDSAYEEHCARRSTEAAVEGAFRALGIEDDPALAALLVLGSDQNFTRQAARGVMLAPGAMAFLERARAATRLAVVTRATRREAELLLSVAGIDAAFDCVICAEDAPTPKPSAAPHEAALTRLGRRRPVDRGRVIALEDGLHGIRAASRAGVRCIAVGAMPAAEAAGAAGAVLSLVDVTPRSLEAILARAEENAA